MFNRIRSRLTYTNLAVTFAVFFAISGGAMAAGHYLITSTKQISPKVLKALKGAAGPSGGAGAAGAAGAQGPAGPAGAKGETGAAGAQGPKGETGSQGPAGTTGFVKSLPSGETLRGQWTISGYSEGGFGGILETSVSFGIPLSEPPITHFIDLGAADPEGCTGTVDEPGAEKGNLCVFAAQEINSSKEFGVFHLPAIYDPSSENGSLGALGMATRYGFGVLAYPESTGNVQDYGSWAVTAE